MINHKVVRSLVALAIGLVLALYTYQCVTDPEPGLQRVREEGIVMVARDILQSYVSPGNAIGIVDAVSPASKSAKSISIRLMRAGSYRVITAAMRTIAGTRT